MYIMGRVVEWLKNSDLYDSGTLMIVKGEARYKLKYAKIQHEVLCWF